MKRKTGQVTKNKLKKPKTLAEKRDQLQDDIMKYGVAAIEKMYPRYAYLQIFYLFTASLFGRYYTTKRTRQINMFNLSFLAVYAANGYHSTLQYLKPKCDNDKIS